nr:MAG TPA: hypothetical protein [Caudoviricetes sp.]
MTTYIIMICVRKMQFKDCYYRKDDKGGTPMNEQENTQQAVPSTESEENVQTTSESTTQEEKENTKNTESTVTLEELQQQNSELQLMVKQMQALLNQQFQQNGNVTQPKDEVEDYFNSEDSMVNRLLKANGYKEEEIREL